MSQHSNIDFTALDANKNRKAKDYWESRLQQLQLPRYFDSIVQNTALGTAQTHISHAPEHLDMVIKTMAPSGKAQHILLLSSLMVFIRKWSSADDIVVFTPGYSADESQNSLNTIVPIRVHEFLEERVVDFINRLKTLLVQDMNHADYPLTKMTGRSLGELISSPTIGFLVKEEQSKTAFEQIKPELLFEIGFSGGLHLELTHADCYDMKNIALLTERFWQFLDRMLEHRNESITSLELISAEEKSLILNVFNATDHPFPKEKTLIHHFEEQVALNPQNRAVACGGKSLSYTELNEKANQVANYLTEQFPKKGAVIGVCMDRSVELIIAIYGILKAGHVYLPLSKDYPKERTNFTVQNSAAKLVFTDDLEAFESINCCNIDCAEAMPTNYASRVLPQDLAYIIYTSGSTGTPKGVLIKHISIVNRINWMQDEYGLTKEDIILQKTPTVFDVSVWELFWWGMYGAQLVLADPGAEKDPEKLAKVIESEGITVMHFVPSMLSVFVNHIQQDVNKYNLSSLKMVFASGEELKPNDAKLLLQFCPQLNLHNLYGPTEATVDVSYYEVTRTKEYTSIPIGKPIHNTTLLIVNEALHLQPIGIPGELLIGGVNLSEGYLNRPELTAEKFIDHPFIIGEKLYRTGDLAKWLPDGNIEYLGRIDNQVKIRGNRIELGEVEFIVKTFPGIEQAIVLPKKNQDNLFLVGYIKCVDGIDEEELLKYLQVKIPDYMIPSYFIHIDEIPLTVNGKADRNYLLGLKREPKTVHIAPQNDTEKSLLQIWESILGNTDFGVTDSFFRVGGDSILAVRLIGMVNSRFERSLEMSELYENDTIRELAVLLYSDASENTVNYTEIEEVILTFGKSYLERSANPLIESVYPMSDIEKAMCYIHLSRPDDVLYFEQIMQHVAYKNLDLNVLQHALDHLIARHEILRTGFDFENFAHVVYKEVNNKLVVHDLTGMDSETQKKVILGNLETARKQHFDLHSYPLWRIIVYKLGESHHELLYEYHHAIFDGWSVANFTTELNNTYAALMSGEPEEAKPLQCSYYDFIRQELAAKQNEKTRNYWINELKDYKKLELNAYSDSKQFFSVREEYPHVLLENLIAASKREGTTVKMLLLTAYIYAMKILSGQQDILVGLITFNRPLQTDGDRILGCFLNEVPFRLVFEEEEQLTWLDLLRKVEQKFVEIKKHDFLSLFEINQAIGAVTYHGNPLFDTTFNFINWHVMNEMKLQSVEDENLDTVGFDSFLRGNTSFDANYNVNDVRILCMHEYATPFMNQETYEQYNSLFLHALKKLTDTPDALPEDGNWFWSNETAKVAAEIDVSGTVQNEKVLRLLPDRVRFWKQELRGWQETLLTDSSLTESEESITTSTYNLTADLSDLIQKKSTSVGLTESSLMCAGFNLFLHKFTGQSTVVTGIGIEQSGSGNKRPMVHGGTPFAFLTDMNESKTVTDYLKACFETHSRITNYSDIAFPTIINKLTEEDAALKNCFQVVIGYRNDIKETLNELYSDQKNHEQSINLILELVVEAGNASIIAHYNTGSFSKTYIEELCIRYHAVLEQLVATEAASIKAIDMLFPEERKHLLAFNADPVDYPESKTLQDIFEKQVELNPENTALISDDISWSYRELNNKANYLAKRIQKSAVAKGSAIGISLKRSPEMIVAILAILKSGCHYVPIDPTLPDSRFSYLLEDSKVQLLLTTSDLLSTEKHAVQLLYLNQIINWSEEDGVSDAHITVNSSDTAYIIYTSGSTGMPKGVRVKHKSVVNLIYAQMAAFEISAQDRILQFSSISFDASVEQIWLALFNGIPLVLVTEDLLIDQGRFVKHIQQQQVTHLHATPSYLDTITLEVPNQLKRIVAGGEECSVRLAEKFKDYTFFNEYGPTETTVTSIMKHVEFPLSDNYVSIGMPIGNTTAYILGNNMEQLPVGYTGELYLGGVGLSDGYVNNDKLTLKQFVENPFESSQKLYKTGDLARYLPDGNIVYEGRIDNQVKIRGYRIELGEIEHQIDSFETIKRSYATVKNYGNDKRIVVYYAADNSIPQSVLETYLADHLPHYMLPAYYVHIKDFELTRNGKLKVDNLPDPEIKRQTGSIAVLSDVEKSMAVVWAEILNVPVEKIDTEASFFELGGNSLLIVKLLAAIRNELGWEISIPQLFATPTIKSLISHITNGESDQTNQHQLIESEIEEMEDMLNLFDLNNEEI